MCTFYFFSCAKVMLIPNTRKLLRQKDDICCTFFFKMCENLVLFLQIKCFAHILFQLFQRTCYFYLPLVPFNYCSIFNVPNASVGDVRKELLVMAHHHNSAFLTLLFQHVIEFCARLFIKMRFGFIKQKQFRFRH